MGTHNIRRSHKRVVYRAFIFINTENLVRPPRALTEETLNNEESQKTLTLYPNGFCKLNSLIPKTGTYNIDDDDKITFEWENSPHEEGLVEWVATTSGARIKSVVYREYTFINEESLYPRRNVVPRHR